METVNETKILFFTIVVLIIGMILGSQIATNDERKNAIKAGVAQRIVANSNDWFTTFVYITNNVTK